MTPAGPIDRDHPRALRTVATGRWLNGFSIRSRVLLLSAILLAMLIGADVFASRALRRADNAREEQRRAGTALAANSEIRSAYADLRHRRAADAGDTGRTTNPDIDPNAALGRIAAGLAQLAQFDAAGANSLRTEILAYDAAAQQVLDPVQQAAARQSRLRVGKQLDVLDASLSEAENKARAALDHELEISTVDGLAVAATMIGLMVTAVVLSSILGSLRQVTQALEAIERGDLDTPLPKSGRGDIGAIAHALRRLRDLQREREALAAENARQQRIRVEAIATFEIGFALFGLDDELLIRNPMFARFHAGIEEMVKPGCRFEDLLRSAIAAGLIDLGGMDRESWIAQRLARRARSEGQTEMRLGQRWVSITERRTVDNVMVEVFSDVTATKLREAELERARQDAEDVNRIKSEFMANMSHELRTPLNAIIGYSQILQEDAEDAGDTAVVADLRKIESAGSHLLGLINDVLDLSKIEAGRMEVYFETLDVAALVQDVRLMVEPLAVANRNALAVTLEPGLGSIVSDVTRLRQCLLNLLGNACKFTKDGRVELDIRRDGDSGRIVFAVSDTGIGMTEAQVAGLFQAFYQADSSTTRQFGGTGLGLVIARGFARMLGGDIAVRSRAGEGSVFTLSLPYQRVPAGSTGGQDDGSVPQPEGSDLDEGVATVLVTDDEAASRRIIGTHLTREGYRVVYASSGQEAIDIARRERPDAITLDILMPSIDGWSVLRALKADPDLSGIPVVLVSLAADRELGFVLRAAAVLNKPVDRAKLLAALRTHIPALHGAPVLVVEDDHETQQVTVRALRRMGLDAVLTANGQEALDWLAANDPPCLILLDLLMPVMDGFDFLRHLRAHEGWAAIPVLVLTAKSLTGPERDLLAATTQQVAAKGAGEFADVLRGAMRQDRPLAPANHRPG